MSQRHAFHKEASKMAERFVDRLANDPVVDAMAAAIFRADYGKDMADETYQICRIHAYEHALAAHSAFQETT